MRLKEFFATPAPGHRIGRPLVIAEAGVNHEGSMEIARRLVAEAAAGGADAIKFQTYRADTLASKDSPAYWDLSKEPTTSQHELFKKHDGFWRKEFETIARWCEEDGIEFLSTPFDLESAAFLDGMMDAFKISSSDITNRPFIEWMAARGKPVLLSTGAADLHEVQEALSWIAPHGVPVCLLHCVLNYPTPDANAHLGMITDLKRRFPECRIGYSDHTLPRDMETLEVATLLGAEILEKHFTHDKTLPGNDHYHAMDTRDLAAFRARWGRVQTLLGSFDVAALPEEAPARAHARRSLVAARAIPAGAVVTAEDLTWKRPAHGISPRQIHEVVGLRARAAIESDTVLRWTHLE